MSYLSKYKEKLLFLPIGGSGEIGMNLNLYGCDGKWVMVDCGMMFADDYTPGVDLILPDPSFVEEEQEDLVGILLTHGHEDHIGAVPYLWERFKCPLYATPFTAELVMGKLREAGIADEVTLHIVEAKKAFDIGPFKATYIPLAHSTAEGHGIALETSKGTVFHTGDWKLDQGPIIGPECPSSALAALGDKGVLALVGDSTNVFNEHSSGSEADVQANLIKLVKDMNKRVVITTFASNVARLETIGAVAKATGRSLALMGRSMQRILAAGRATGYLKNLPTLVDEAYIDDIPKDKILIACTGCQGEPRAAIARIARGEHKAISLAEGDTVIFSSKIIPGNELTLGALFNALVEKKVNVVTEKDAFVHVSGHPGRADLRQMFEWVKPQSVIPVHGERRHLERHAAFAREVGIKKTIVPQNGDVIEISDKGLRRIDTVPTGRLARDGSETVPINDINIAERRRASLSGFITVSLVFDGKDKLAAEPLLAIMGVPRGKDDVFYDELLEAVEEAVERMSIKSRRTDFDVEEVSRIAVRRCCRKLVGKNPGVATLITRRRDMEL